MKQSSSTGLIVGGVVLLFAAFSFVLYSSDALVFTGSDPSAKVVSAVLALVGAFIAAVFSLIAILLKHTIDDRAEARLLLEAERNEVLRRDSERRLQLEAAIRAIELFATSDGRATLPIQRAGALLALSSLGQHSVTLSLLAELLDTSGCEPSTVVQIIDDALLTGDPNLQGRAIGLLEQHAHKLLTPSGFEFPGVILEQTLPLPVYVREWAPIALVNVLTARPLEEWQASYEYSAFGIISALTVAYQRESIEHFKSAVGAILREVFQAFPDVGVIFHSETIVVDCDVTRDDVQKTDPTTHESFDAVDKLKAWRGVTNSTLLKL